MSLYGGRERMSAISLPSGTTCPCAAASRRLSWSRLRSPRAAAVAAAHRCSAEISERGTVRVMADSLTERNGVGEGARMAVRVDLGGRRIVSNNKTQSQQKQVNT